MKLWGEMICQTHTSLWKKHGEWLSGFYLSIFVIVSLIVGEIVFNYTDNPSDPFLIWFIAGIGQLIVGAIVTAFGLAVIAATVVLVYFLLSFFHKMGKAWPEPRKEIASKFDELEEKKRQRKVEFDSAAGNIE